MCGANFREWVVRIVDSTHPFRLSFSFQRRPKHIAELRLFLLTFSRHRSRERNSRYSCQRNLDTKLTCFFYSRLVLPSSPFPFFLLLRVVPAPPFLLHTCPVRT